MFPRAPPLSSPSIEQQWQRRQFQQAALAWWTLTTDKRQSWRDLARLANLRITAYNLFTYWILTNDVAKIQTLENQTGVSVLGN